MDTETEAPLKHPVRQELTELITYYIAAAIISDRQFPRKGFLPTPLAAPMHSLGHYVMLDYGLLLRIIWQVIDQIKDSTGKIYRGIPSKSWVIGVVTAVIVFILLSIMETGAGFAFFLALLGGAGGVFLSVNNARNKLLLKEVATIRADAIRKLVAGEWSLASNGKMSEKIENELSSKEVGDGSLDGGKIPVLVITDDKHPFPGYGHLQAENVFICRPKKAASLDSSFDETFETVENNIVSAVSKFPVGDLSCGDILVLHGNSLPMDSPWLKKNKAPKLWLERDRLESFSAIDERVSIRRYFAVQTLFSNYNTLATFFIRPFMAGNSLCCQIAFRTMGPIRYGADYFQQRLLRYEEEDKNGYAIKPVVRPNQKKEVSDSARLIQDIRRLAKSDVEFQSHLINYQEIKKLDPLDKEADEEYKKEFKEMVKKSTVWLGGLVLTPNWRETYSMTFTDDFFGKTEALSSVRTLYDQLGRTILDTFESLGFDISDYRDAEGNYSIHAEKIEQLVVGENIQMAERKGDKPSVDQAQPAVQR